MQLKSIEYVEYQNTPKEWGLEGFLPEKINLIVGKNATGKSRTLRLIRALGNLLAGDIRLSWDSGDYKVNFENEGRQIRYCLKYNNSKLVNESLEIEEEEKLKRAEDGKGTIFANKIGKKGQNIEFQVQDNELAVVSKRDKLQHPFLETLISWGKLMRFYPFGSSLGQHELIVPGASDVEAQLNLKEAQHVVMILKMGMEKEPTKFTEMIAKDMEAIGYELEGLRIAALAKAVVGGVPSPAIGITVKEQNLSNEVVQGNISQGMFRALSLIIQLNYSYLFCLPSCILIDDIGEGLDYDRSKELIKLLIKKAKNAEVQLIMATNDRFVMNNVSLENWSIMSRFSKGTRVLNYKNARKIFEKFELTGLSNFDLFSSEFYKEEIDEQ
jgi:predicted ATPase